MSSEYCVCCGAEIPEGRMICPACEDKTEIEDVAICRRCGRKLRTEEARERGMGKICWMKSHTTDRKKPLFLAVRRK